MAVTLVIIGLVAFFALSFYLYRKLFCYNYFKKLGIPGPEPHWLFGNLHQLWATDDRHLLVHSWSQKYGKFFGYYEGSTPILVTSSTDAVEQMCVKQFNIFQSRRNLPFIPDPEKFPDSPFANVGAFWGEKWKRLRTIANPGFSTGKLKAYSPLIGQSQDDLTEVFAEKAASGESFDIFTVLQCLALDVISEVAFGIELNSVKSRGANSPLLPKFHNLLPLFSSEPFALKIGLVLPEIAPLIQKLIVLQMNASVGILKSFKELEIIARTVIANRRDNPSQKRNDLLQMLIDSTGSEEASNLRPLSDIEVTSQAIQFFLAGTNTTTATMSYASFILATHPVQQEKLYQEIIAAFPNPKAKPDYDTVMKIPYLDWFLHETLRTHPVATFIVNRVASEPTEVCGIPIGKHEVAMITDVYSIHHDPDIWGPVDPAQFHPERFSPDYPTTANRPSSAFLGFGHGPRICLGMRLAFFEMKLTMINLVRRFRVLEPEGGFPGGRVAVTVSTAMLPKNGVRVRLQERN